jgi:hypothetical protein
MSYTPAQFLLRFPEFSAVTPPPGMGLTSADVIQAQLDDMDADTSDSFGALRDRAVFLQTAHELAVRYRVNLAPYGVNNLTAPGISSGMQVAGHSVSEQYVLPANLTQHRGDWRAWFSLTKYGLEYLALCAKGLSKGALSSDSEEDGSYA